jgi:hypothetical protein
VEGEKRPSASIAFAVIDDKTAMPHDEGVHWNGYIFDV